MYYGIQRLLLFFFILPFALFLTGCDGNEEDSSFNNNNWVLMGCQEGLIFQEFDPPLSVSGHSAEILIYPLDDGGDYIHLSVYSSGPTGCRNYKQEVMIAGSDSISFLYNYEEHVEYHIAQWKEYIYSWSGVEIDSVYEHMYSFEESGSVLEPRGMNVLSVFSRGDTVFNSGYFSEGGSLFYIFDSRVDYNMSTNPGNACRLASDSSYVRNDTSIVFFTESIHNYRYNSELYNPDGVYLMFKLEEKGRERLGWLKFSTTGTAAQVSGCAIQE